MTIAIHNIAIEVSEGDEYTTPDIEKAMKYYPTYYAHCLRMGIEPWKRRPYILAVFHELERSGIVRDGRKIERDELFKRALDHFGLHWFQRWFDEQDVQIFLRKHRRDFGSNRKGIPR